MERGGINLYEFSYNNPLYWADPLGFDGLTIGPISFFYNEGGLTPAEKAAERAHEKQHRKDFCSGLPGWLKEQRAFAAEADSLRQSIAAMQANLSSPASELQTAQTALSTAETIANDFRNAMDYWNQADRQWWQPPIQIPPPLPPGYVPPPQNICRNCPPPIIIVK